MSDHFQHIYAERAEAYDRLIQAEDCEGQILRTIERLHPLDGARVVEVGVGTGRIARQLVRAGVASVLGIDDAPAMLAIAHKHLEACAPPGSRSTWQLELGDASRLPVTEGGAELVIAGWVFGHATEWAPDAWHGRIGANLDELDRVTQRGGTQILFETLGTGTDDSGAPSPELAAYYAYLEDDRSFAHHVIRTDYEFESPQAAADACAFFFGDALANRILERAWSRVPEWTGVWWRRR